jgi:hypothetical protein
MCKFLDKSSVAQFLDRGLKGRLHFPWARHNSAKREMQYAANRHDGRLGWTNSLGGGSLNLRSVSSVLAATSTLRRPLCAPFTDDNERQ